MNTFDAADIAECYRILLGREPENNRVLDDKIRGCNSLKSLLLEFVNSSEYIGKRWEDAIILQYRSTAVIDVDVSDEQLAALFSHIHKEWSILGEEDPYWSVKTSEKYRFNNFHENSHDFYESGKKDADLLILFCDRAEIKIPSGICLELGCGVGRITKNLSPLFDKVLGVDISLGNLLIAEEYLKGQNINNVELLHLTDLAHINNVENFDFLFSLIVLQHNPPPIQNFILDILFKKLNSNGICFFQLVVDYPNYNFNIDTYLSNLGTGMEIHSFPIHKLMQIFKSNNIQVLDFRPDKFTGAYGSYTFLAQKN